MPLVITRILDAPRERVWQACSEREQFMRWWGQPKVCTATFNNMDFRVGGSFHFKVELPTGVVMWGKSIYKEIVPRERLVLEDYYSNENGDLLDTAELPKSLITLTLEDEGEKTKLTVRHEGIGVGEHTIDQYRQGWNEVLDRLTQVIK